ncbi:MAG TPA: response regulator [Candidatus Omnitrophota bacterium]|nr:response regulator [Candidatus Omnitrophota bacterium]
MKKRILIIEDEKEIAMIMRMRLEASGYDAVEAFDGLEGLRQAKNCSPDLILLDLILPKMAGTQILEELKKDERYRNIPVIIVTGLAQEATSHQEMIAKADAFFLKPFDTVELMTAIADLLKSPHSNN